MPLSTISLKRPITRYITVQKILAPLIRNRKIFLRSSELSNKKYLNLGCGIFTHKNFINLDYEWNEGIDICWDLSKGIPLIDESIQGIFTEHCLEHFSIEQLDFILSECFRILKPGGILRLVVPDGKYFLNCYVNLIEQKPSLPLSSEFCKDQASYKDIYTPIMAINKLFYSWEHRFIFDFETIRHLLQKNNFQDIQQHTFLVGHDSNLLIDSEHRKVGSLYVEALKF